MTANRIIHHIFDRPDLRNVDQASLERLVEAYPYFAAARVMLAQKQFFSLPDYNTPVFKKAQLYTSTPQYLYQLTQPEVAEPVREARPAVDIVAKLEAEAEASLTEDATADPDALMEDVVAEEPPVNVSAPLSQEAEIALEDTISAEDQAILDELEAEDRAAAEKETKRIADEEAAKAAEAEAKRIAEEEAAAKAAAEAEAQRIAEEEAAAKAAAEAEAKRIADEEAAAKAAAEAEAQRIAEEEAAAKAAAEAEAKRIAEEEVAAKAAAEAEAQRIAEEEAAAKAAAEAEAKRIAEEEAAAKAAEAEAKRIAEEEAAAKAAAEAETQRIAEEEAAAKAAAEAEAKRIAEEEAAAKAAAEAEAKRIAEEAAAKAAAEAEAKRIAEEEAAAKAAAEAEKDEIVAVDLEAAEAEIARNSVEDEIVAVDYEAAEAEIARNSIEDEIVAIDYDALKPEEPSQYEPEIEEEEIVVESDAQPEGPGIALPKADPETPLVKLAADEDVEDDTAAPAAGDESPIRIHPMDTPTEETVLTFQPLYTEDYFAYKKLKDPTTAEMMTEKAAAEMRSFTDWLREIKDNFAGKSSRDWYHQQLHKLYEDDDPEVTERVEKMAIQSITLNDDIVSETLAEIWVRQHQPEKAIGIYQKLSLLNPGKNAYFAQRINELKQQLTDNNK